MAALYIADPRPWLYALICADLLTQLKPHAAKKKIKIKNKYKKRKENSMHVGNRRLRDTL